MKKTTKKSAPVKVKKLVKKTKKPEESSKGKKIVGYKVLNGHTMKDMDMNQLPADIRKVIEGISKQFGKIGVEVEMIGEGESDTNYFIPTSPERFAEVQKESEEICVKGKKGFMFQGTIVDDPNLPKECVASVKGICKMNNVPAEYVLLSMVKHMGMSNQDAIAILSDKKYLVRDNPNKW